MLRRVLKCSLTDKFGRAITDLRISITDRCNYKCVYCRTGNEGALYGELPFADYLRMARVLVSLGIKKVRLTGGEPLLRKGVVEFVRDLAQACATDRTGEPLDTRHHHQWPSAGRSGAAAERCRPEPRHRQHGRSRSRQLCAHHARARRIRSRARRNSCRARAGLWPGESELRSDARLQ